MCYNTEVGEFVAKKCHRWMESQSPFRTCYPQSGSYFCDAIEVIRVRRSCPRNRASQGWSFVKNRIVLTSDQQTELRFNRKHIAVNWNAHMALTRVEKTANTPDATIKRKVGNFASSKRLHGMLGIRNQPRPRQLFWATLSLITERQATTLMNESQWCSNQAPLISQTNTKQFELGSRPHVRTIGI